MRSSKMFILITIIVFGKKKSQPMIRQNHLSQGQTQQFLMTRLLKASNHPQQHIIMKNYWETISILVLENYLSLIR